MGYCSITIDASAVIMHYNVTDIPTNALHSQVEVLTGHVPLGRDLIPPT